MNNPAAMDVDPLSAYDGQYGWSGPVRVEMLPSANPYQAGVGNSASYDYQDEQPHNYTMNNYQPAPEATHPNYNLPQETQPTTSQTQPTTSQIQPTTGQPRIVTNLGQLQPINGHIESTLHPLPTTNKVQCDSKEELRNEPNLEEDIKPDLAVLEASLKTNSKRTKNAKPKGRVSSYWNKKITDKDFAFYGCSLCNIPFQDIMSLDKHMLIHSNRVTTYEIRKINVEKRKMMKKEQKRKRREERIKKEMEAEIKPEDGYIGTDKAVEVNNRTGQDTQSKVKPKKKPKTLEDYDKNSPAYLREVNKQNFIHAYKCFGCDKVFALSYYLRLHVRSHTGEKPYSCQICGQKFITASKMNRHTKRIHMATRHQCRICYRVFTRFELLVKHFDTKHPESKLDGEVYDYNAILPYIKELEEQLREQVKKQEKLKTEDPWGSNMVEGGAGQTMVAGVCTKEEQCITKKEVDTDQTLNVEFVDEKERKHFESSDKVSVTEIKIDIEMKREKDEYDENCETSFQDEDDDMFKTQGQDSDEEYLPSQTWVRPHSPLQSAKKQNKNKKVIKMENNDYITIEIENSDDVTAENDDSDHQTADHEKSGDENSKGNNNKKWEQPTRCPLCDKYISKMKNLAGHLNTHNENKPFICAECDRKYCTPAALKKHIRSAHPDSIQGTGDEVNSKEEKKEEKKDKENKKEKEAGVEDKIKEDPTSDEEYFPSETWARPPSPLPEPPGQGGGKVCPVCKKKLSSKTYLAVHMRTHTGEKPFACYICGRGFITSSKMHRHVLTHDETWEGKELKPESEEDNKESLQHKSKAKMAARKSRKAFFEKKERKHGPWTLSCEFCNKKFLHQITHDVHIKTHNLNENMKCYYCLEEFQNVDQLRSHKDNHSPPNLYQCQYCKKDFGKKGPMMAHRKKCERKMSAGGKILTCEICSKRFNCTSRLQRHMAAHTSSQYSLKYECPVCAHMFHTRYHIQMHLRSHIKEGIILEENRGAVLAMVLQNARKIPKPNSAPPPTPPPTTDERSRICNICGEIFQHFYFLEQHLKLHANKIDLADLEEDGGEKKHVCPVCSKSFKLPYYLKLHSFTHTKEKPFICQECGKGFITRGKLKRHLETHQGLKKYQCHVCYKFFTRTSYLRIHIRTIHGPQEFGVGVPIGVCQGLPMSS